MGITYHVMDPASLEDRSVLEAAKTLPMTVFVRAGEDRTVEQVLSGGGHLRGEADGLPGGKPVP
jgi:hypothetical protein